MLKTGVSRTKRKKSVVLGKYKPLTMWKINERDVLKKKLLEYIEKLINESPE